MIWYGFDLNEAIDLSIYLSGRFEPCFFTIKSLAENDKYDWWHWSRNGCILYI